VAQRIRRTWEEYFAGHDLLVMPATPCPALTPAEFTAENRMRLLALTAPASLAGLPALTIPVNLTAETGARTAGLQILAREPSSPLFAGLLG
jgi:aspartyl-tRNA(Asn)/glutamyl-tRNA(Gln) amidotransferase subunit A